MKNIEIKDYPSSLSLSDSGDMVIIGTKSGFLKVYDYHLGLEVEK